MTSPLPFGLKLQQSCAQLGRLCVGIDPHAGLLRAWGLEESAAGTREFGMRIVDACADRVAIIKPQVAFFEQYGSAGYSALEDVLGAARSAGILVIADAKRGDIGSTMDGYARAWLAPGMPLEVDALTVTPYLGVGALRPSMEFAQANGKGLFVLAATSNPEATTLQRATLGTESHSVARHIIDEVWAFNTAATTDPTAGESTSIRSSTGWASMGVVVGATVDLTAAGLGTDLLPIAPVLSPGFGHQGALLSDIPDIFGTLASAVIANESRGVVSGGPAELIARIDERQRMLRTMDEGTAS